MRAVVLDGERSVSVSEVPDAALSGPDGVVVGVEQAAICGSDLHLYHGEVGGLGIRLGHEFIGTVLEAGPDVRRFRPGSRVLVSGVIGCGRCPACVAGDPVACRNDGLAIFGTGLDLPGGQAEAVAVPAADVFCLDVPEAVTPEQALLLTDILPTGYLAALRAQISPGSTVAVIGLGPVGILALMCAQLFGPARVLAVDRVPDRLRRAEELGAEPLDAGQAGAADLIRQATGGWGAPSVIEAVGSDVTLGEALHAAAPDGTVSVVGVNLAMAFPFPITLALLRSLTFRVTLAAIPSTWEALVPLLESGRLHPDAVFTHRMGLSEAPLAYRTFDDRTDGVLKVMLDPSR
ncbi:MAG TPA: alcohol dehydrogenase catalytic domain-containing protein [Acidimicrobiales bacterium]|nr:alcohol dehydrogenase catalytic domain-containing protein [Acidimicrobiales bacterium]